VTAAQLEALLLVQERDLAVDRLVHRRETLPERETLAQRNAALAAREREGSEVRSRRDAVLAEERRLDDESRAIGDKAAGVERRMYSGAVSSPRELQAMQADVDMLRRQRSDLEDRELEVIEEREVLDQTLAGLEREADGLRAEITALEAAIEAAEAEIDAELTTERAARDAHAADVPAALLADYERRRARNRGAGAARLVGVTCQACHLSIPSTEAERIRRAAGEVVAYCDNCGAILVP
jgi:hypothetical protein